MNLPKFNLNSRKLWTKQGSKKRYIAGAIMTYRPNNEWLIDLINPIWHGRGDILIPLSLLDQILSADFFSQISKKFLRRKFTSIWLFLHPAQLIESYKSCFLVALAFQPHARQGLDTRHITCNQPSTLVLMMTWSSKLSTICPLTISWISNSNDARLDFW